ncbi:MAG: hypothetical protein R3A44_38525 [Caldilineaceae bacterium]
MAHKPTKSTGLGADAFFAVPTSSSPKKASAATPTDHTRQHRQPAPVPEASERRSFNLRLSILRQLDEIQIKTIREGKKQTLSSIVERGIELVAREMDISDEMDKRVNESKNK